MADHVLPQLMDAEVLVTINSDDPAYFGGYLADNYRAVANAFDQDVADVVTLARNSIEASFLPDTRKSQLFDEVDRVRDRGTRGDSNP